jgi:hypothetical protein
MLHCIIFFFLLIGTVTGVRAQDTTATKPITTATTIYLKDGSQLRGTLLEETAESIRIKMDNLGEVTLALDKIERIERYTGGFYKNGRYWISNPHSTRYFWAPSALPLRKGEGYYQNAYVFVNSASVGVTDHFTMGGGFVLNPTFRDWQVLFLTPKISFPSQSNVTFGAGLIAVGVFNKQYNYDYQTGQELPSRIKANLGGITYGNVTFGGVERNASIGLGWGFTNENVASQPVLNVSYMSRIGRKMGFVTENWIIIPGGRGGGISILSGGIRFFSDRTAIDLALLVPAGLDTFIAIPYVDFVLKFGR